MPENTDVTAKEFTVTFDALTADGQAIGHLPPENNDGTRGLTLFCDGLLPEETAGIRIISQKKNFATAECLRLITPSPDRIEPFCPVYAECGGCTLQHLSYEAQLAVKRHHVVSCLTRIAHQPAEHIESITRPAIGMAFPYDYRNHMQYPAGETMIAAVGAESDVVVVAGAPVPVAAGAPADTLAAGASRDLKIGLYGRKSHTIVPHKACRIAHPACESIRRATEKFCLENGVYGFDENTGIGFLRHLIVRVGVRTGEVMVMLVGHVRPEIENPFPVEAYVEYVKEQLKRDRRIYENIDTHASNKIPHDAAAAALPWMLKSVWLNCNPTGARQGQTVSFRKENQKLLWGKSNIREQIGDNMYIISPLSFFQVNTAQAEKLYDTVRAFARGELTADAAHPSAPAVQPVCPEEIWPVDYGETGVTAPASACTIEVTEAAAADAAGTQILVDFYCGTGSIGLHLAKDAGLIIGIESNESAVLDARENAARNGIAHAEFRVARAEDISPSNLPKKIDCIILDPPRSGCDPKLLTGVLKLAPPKIIYVSCDPATMSRDIAILTTEKYGLKAIQPVDMFPWSGHVESVVWLERV